MRIMLFVLAVLALTVASVDAQTQSDPNASQEGWGTNAGAEADPLGGQADPSADAGTADPAADTSAAADSMASDEIKATVSSIDKEKGELKVNEESGAERTFQISDSQALQDIQAGDQVRITLDPNDPSMVQAVEKADEAQSQPLM